jgi:hypothetical protein
LQLIWSRTLEVLFYRGEETFLVTWFSGQLETLWARLARLECLPLSLMKLILSSPMLWYTFLSTKNILHFIQLFSCVLCASSKSTDIVLLVFKKKTCNEHVAIESTFVFGRYSAGRRLLYSTRVQGHVIW